MAILINVLFAAWVGAAPMQASAPPAIGFVVTLSGQWQADGHDVKRGQAIAAGVTLAPASATGTRSNTGEPSAIKVVLLNNTVVECPSRATPDCQHGVVMPSNLNERSTVIARIHDVFALIFENPERWVGLVSRDIGRVNLADGVIQYDRGRVSLAQVLSGIPAGDYDLRFTPVENAGAPNRGATTIQVSWTGTAPATAQAALGLGLYRVTLGRKGVTGMVGREGWMLAAGASQAAAMRARFESAVTSTRAWEPAVPHIDVERFLHAYLAELAREK